MVQCTTENFPLPPQGFLYDEAKVGTLVSLTSSPDSKNVYVIFKALRYHAVGVFSRDVDDNGKLSFVHLLKDGDGGLQLYGAKSVTVSPDGINVYVASVDGLAVLTNNETLFLVQFLKADSDEGSPISVTISRDGNNVYVVSRHTLTVFSRDVDDSGKLSLVHVVNDIDIYDYKIYYHAESGINELITVSTNGKHVYVVSKHHGKVFSRDADDRGKLSFVHALKDGVDDYARSVTVSPDGKNVYVVTSVDFTNGAIAVFSRDGGDGKHSFVQVLRDCCIGLHGLGRGKSVSVSPDGANVYVAISSPDNAVAVFSRDADNDGKSLRPCLETDRFWAGFVCNRQC